MVEGKYNSQSQVFTLTKTLRGDDELIGSSGACQEASKPEEFQVLVSLQFGEKKAVKILQKYFNMERRLINYGIVRRLFLVLCFVVVLFQQRVFSRD